MERDGGPRTTAQLAAGPLDDARPTSLTPEQLRVRGLVAARFPTDQLSRPDFIEFLSGLLGDDAQHFQVGDSFWLAVLTARNNDNARAAMKTLTQDLEASGAGVRGLATRMVAKGFSLTHDSLAGTAAPPREVLDVLEEAARK